MSIPLDALDMDTVAALLEVSVRQVRNYINQQGLPTHGEGRNRHVRWRELRQWDFERRMEMELGGGNDGNDDPESEVTSGKEDIRAANLRKTKAEADLKQLALSKLRGEVIVIGDAKLRLDRMLGNLRTQLLSLPPKLSSRIEGESTPPAREAVIRDELENICRELSTGAIVGGPPDESAATIEQMSAAAEADVDRIVHEYIAAQQDADAVV